MSDPSDPKLSPVYEDQEGANTTVAKYIRRARYIFGQGAAWEIIDGLSVVIIMGIILALLVMVPSLYGRIAAGLAAVLYALDLKYDFSDKARRFNRAIQAAFKARGIEYMRKFPESTPALELILDAIDETTTGGPTVFRGKRLKPERVREILARRPDLADHVHGFLQDAGMLDSAMEAVFHQK